MTERGQRTKIKPIDEASQHEVDVVIDGYEFNKMEILTTSKIECEVVFTTKNQTAVDFMGYGVFVKGVYSTTNVIVEYKGEIGKSDFEIISVKGV